MEHTIKTVPAVIEKRERIVVEDVVVTPEEQRLVITLTEREAAHLLNIFYERDGFDADHTPLENDIYRACLHFGNAAVQAVGLPSREREAARRQVWASSAARFRCNR